jgi:Cu/Ag efflux pump CusA
MSGKMKIFLSYLAVVLATAGAHLQSASAADGEDARDAKQQQPLPVVTVEASYAGANAQVVADTVAAPIEAQVDGVEKLLYMRSRCGNDGAYRLDVVFQPGVDLNGAKALVQKRVNFAAAALPDIVKQSGLSHRHASFRNERAPANWSQHDEGLRQRLPVG